MGEVDASDCSGKDFMPKIGKTRRSMAYIYQRRVVLRHTDGLKVESLSELLYRKVDQS